MFIPQGKVVHQNLATSYVLVDALVADLCEGGFSGVVEIMLRDTDNHIVFDRGKVIGVIEKRGAQYVIKTAISELTARAGGERGRVNIYAYAVPVAKALAGRMFAETLYAKLSTEFADLEKLIGKFMRERERLWFIEVFADADPVMIFIDDGRCSVIPSNALANDSDLEIAGLQNHVALLQLIERCQQTGGSFDVHFKTAEDDSAAEPSPVEMRASQLESPSPQPAAPVRVAVSSSPVEAKPQPDLGISRESASHQEEIAALLSPRPVSQAQAPDLIAADDADMMKVAQPATSGFTAPANANAKNGAAQPSNFNALVSASDVDEDNAPVSNPTKAKAQPTPKAASQPKDLRILPTRELMALSGDAENAADDYRMAEVKRLLGEIAKAIEDVLRIIEQRDDFPLHLRAGQLKLALQYPFLDPFGAEFEYMEGEIVFVGQAEADDFIAGVTDALRLAVTSALQESANPTRLRSFIIDKLRFILNRSREEYVSYGLDASLEQIAGVQF